MLLYSIMCVYVVWCITECLYLRAHCVTSIVVFSVANLNSIIYKAVLPHNFQQRSKTKPKSIFFCSLHQVVPAAAAGPRLPPRFSGFRVFPIPNSGLLLSRVLSSPVSTWFRIFGIFFLMRDSERSLFPLVVPPRGMNLHAGCLEVFVLASDK